MNTIKIATLNLAGLLLTLAACEGEPPKVPVNPPATPIAEPAQAKTAAPGANAATETPAPNGAGPSAGPCPCAACTPQSGSKPVDAGGPSAAAPVAVATPTAPSATPSAEGAAPLAANHAITGTVTTMPARAAGTAVVYLEDAGSLAGRGASAFVDNHGMSFIPYITVVSAGGRVVFSNTDPFPHNVFSPDNEKFNLGTVQMKGSSSHTFKSAGVYTLLCNLHPNMLGYVVVSPSSYFAKANAKGQFAIKDVPPGTYKITAWAPRLQPVTQSITLKDADTAADFALHH